MKFTKNIQKFVIVLLLLCNNIFIVFAQPGGPGGEPGDTDPPVGGDVTPVGVPLDGGTTALIIIGLILFLEQRFHFSKRILHRS